LNRLQAAGKWFDKHCASVGQPIGNVVQLRLVGDKTLAPAAARVTTVPGLDTGAYHTAGDILTMAEIAGATRDAKIVDPTNGAVKGWRKTDAIACSHGCHILAGFVDDTDDLVSEHERGRGQR
jgi:hypothetical protein